jgi:hypothetical protein
MSIQDSNMPDARPGAPLLQESDLVVRVFSRKKLGEARRRTDHPILVSAQMIHQLRNMTLKDASKELVRTCLLSLTQSNRGSRGSSSFLPPPPLPPHI